MIQRIISFVISAFFSICLFAQHSNTLYFMDRIPQSTQLNPAFQPNCNLFIQNPISISLNVGTNSLSMSNLMPYNSSVGSVTWFLHPAADRNTFINSLEDENKIFNNTQVDIIAFGFKVNTWYFSYNFSLKHDLTFSYPKDLVKAAIIGWKPGSNYDLTKLGINTTTYLENAFAASKIINEDFTVGARFKVLHGLFDISTLNDNFQFNCSEIPAGQDNEYMYQLDAKSDITINAYLPYFTVPNDSVKLSQIKTKKNLGRSFLPLSSKGIGFDLGVTYTGIDQFVFSASLLDLGFINWRNSAYSFKLNGKYSFKGIDIDLDSLDKSLSSLSDSINEKFKFKSSKKNYTRSLPSRMYIGAEYTPIKYLTFGLLSLSQYYRREFYQQITVSANFKPFEMWDISASYSFLNNNFSYMGFGSSLCFGPVQIFGILESSPISFGRNGSSFIPYKLENLNFRSGMNWVFGKGNKKAMKDQPLLWE